LGPLMLCVYGLDVNETIQKCSFCHGSSAWLALEGSAQSLPAQISFFERTICSPEEEQASATC
jgi:hypothetical protein